MEFAPYDKIAERLEADEAAHRALARVHWVVTEKIHGANLALIADGNDVRAAKRKALLEPAEEFFGWQAIVARLADPVNAVATAARATDASAINIIIYGELFGGGYPHPDVAPVAGVEPVQTGVWYAPGIEWRAFDVAIVNADGITMLDWEQAEPLLARAGVPFVRPRFVGKMSDAQNYVLGFETAIPAELGLPPIAGNRAEGIVIKPIRAVTVDGARVAPRLKRKLEEFAEDERFHGAQKWGAPRRSASDHSAVLLEALRARINEPRVNAARSKIGRIRRDDHKRRAELQALIVDEVLDEVSASHAKEWKRLGPVEREALRTQATTDVAHLIERMLR
jgi:Rnl2 family RNA ligase